MAINTDKLVVEIALEWPYLRVKLLLGHHKGDLVCLALCSIDVMVLASSAFLLGFTVLRGLSTLTMKIAPPQKGGRESSSVVVLVTVSVEP